MPRVKQGSSEGNVVPGFPTESVREFADASPTNASPILVRFSKQASLMLLFAVAIAFVVASVDAAFSCLVFVHLKLMYADRFLGS